MNGAAAWRRRFAIGLLGLYAAAAAPGAFASLWRALREAIVTAPADLTAARRRVFGAEYVDGIERLRARIPADGQYLLFDAGNVEEGARNWVRYDLAPRRAIFGGFVARLGRPERVRAKFSRAPADWVVAFPGGRAPRHMTRAEFVAWLAEDGGGG